MTYSVLFPKTVLSRQSSLHIHECSPLRLHFPCSFRSVLLQLQYHHRKDDSTHENIEEKIVFCFSSDFAACPGCTGCVRGRAQSLRAPGSGACLRKMDGNQRLSHILLLLLQRSDSDVRFPEGI